MDGKNTGKHSGWEGVAVDTQRIRAGLLNEQDTGILQCAAILRAGGLVAIPTETVYGLAANALDDRAVARIFAAKGRPQDNPLIVHIADSAMLPSLALEIPPQAERLMTEFWPGPLTLVFKKTALVPARTSGGLGTVAVRMPDHPVACAVIRAAGLPLAAPSANLSGSPSPTTAQHVLDDLDGRIDAVVDGGPCGVGVESTVLSLVGAVPRVLRPGGITVPQLQAVLGEVEIDSAVFNMFDEETAASSPGMKYKHYSPKAAVVVIKGDSARYAAFVNARAGDGVHALCFEEDLERLRVPSTSYGPSQDASLQAKKLFAALRGLDEQKAQLVYAHSPSTEGVGLAVYNRLLRAAEFKVVDV